jgi:hypothetical protein
MSCLLVGRSIARGDCCAFEELAQTKVAQQITIAERGAATRVLLLQRGITKVLHSSFWQRCMVNKEVFY